MKFTQHLFFSIVLIYLIQKLDLPIQFIKFDIIYSILIGSFACLLPDIDCPQSIIGKHIKCIAIVFLKFFGHRNFTHSFLVILGFLFFMQIQNNMFYIFDRIIFQKILCYVLIGYLSHVISDMCTPFGVSIFWPYKKSFNFLQNYFFFKNYKIYYLVLIFLVFYSNVFLLRYIYLILYFLQYFFILCYKFFIVCLNIKYIMIYNIIH